jgi:hypothetical protein
MQQRQPKRIVIVRRRGYGRGLGDVSYGGDHFKGGFNLSVGDWIYPMIEEAMNNSGEFYSVSVYSTSGFFTPWVTVEGFIAGGGYYTTPYQVQSAILSYVQAVLNKRYPGNRVDSATWQWVDLETHADDSGAQTGHVNTQPKGDGGGGGGGGGGNNNECGALDQLGIALGLKKSCSESILSTPSSLFTGAFIMILGLVVLNKVTK